ncbi:heavy-metal-associated domain-containing protein [Thermococcus argininiproducens]|uniref:Heavy-metal-associated domain-containing protein n=1 Tax=Thermococcus argininiproducens TaxID=2866384 RepID=A0A9E7MAN9_9EURY|nr:heavy-metal-associated domain-containing protein [Thermococcus argininiproducens]USH00156.1 heavy-metal-associated domain-containing protein [Thermococcus argininiproducens]
MAKVVLNIKNMSCQHCVMTIKRALEKIGAKAEVSLKEKKAVVEYDESKLKVEDLMSAISKFGYEAEVA